MDTISITVKPVVYGDDGYHRMVACRNAVLREPLGRRLTEDELARDVAYLHYAAFTDDGEVVGTVLLGALSATQVRARQVSVQAEVQGSGVGTRLMAFAEGQARTQGFSEMVLHARETAVPFYERIGYVAEGEFFEESGLPHILMRKQL